MAEKYHEIPVHVPYGINLPHSNSAQLGTSLGSLAIVPTRGGRTVAWQSASAHFIAILITLILQVDMEQLAEQFT